MNTLEALILLMESMEAGIWLVYNSFGAFSADALFLGNLTRWSRYAGTTDSVPLLISVVMSL